MDMETQVRQAIARGYCHPANAKKELDSVLIEAMVAEVVKLFSPPMNDTDVSNAENIK